jgi:hypothetical protein
MNISRGRRLASISKTILDFWDTFTYSLAETALLIGTLLALVTIVRWALGLL